MEIPGSIDKQLEHMDAIQRRAKKERGQAPDNKADSEPAAVDQFENADDKNSVMSGFARNMVNIYGKE